MNSYSDERLCGMLGMARRAGRITVGFDASAAAVATHKAKAVVVASDASEKTVKEMRFLKQKHSSSASVLFLPMTKERLGDVLGYQKAIGVAALTDKGFATAIEKMLAISPANVRSDRMEEPHR